MNRIRGILQGNDHHSSDGVKGSRFADMRVSNPTPSFKKEHAALAQFLEIRLCVLASSFSAGNRVGTSHGLIMSDARLHELCSCVAHELCTLQQLFLDAACLPTGLLDRLGLNRQPVNPETSDISIESEEL